MSELPDDVRAFEAQLGQLKPAHRLDIDQLNYEAGYAAGLAARTSASSARRTLPLISSAVLGAAALYGVLALLGMQTERSSRDGNQTMTAASDLPNAVEAVESNTAVAPFSVARTHRDLFPGSGVLSIESDRGVRTLRPATEPPQVPIRTMLEWRDEIFDNGIYFGGTS